MGVKCSRSGPQGMGGWGGVAGSAAGRHGRETLNSGHPSHWGSQEAAQNRSVRDTHPPRDEGTGAFRHQLLKATDAGSSYGFTAPLLGLAASGRQRKPPAENGRCLQAGNHKCPEVRDGGWAPTVAVPGGDI